ncbi:MAG: phosphatase PAP2 family protein [Clostridia bacterium]|nr:phosphatase PAP2 family protein [Clostridia bacterium]
MLNLFASQGTVWFWEFEKQFILWLQSLGGEGSLIYYLMNFFTLFGEEIVIIAVMGVIYWGLDKNKGEMIGASVMTAAVVNPLIKNIFCRVRPFDTFPSEIKNLKDVDGFSFPSGHSSSSSTLMGSLALTYRKQRLKWLTAIAIVIPLLVALSRNYLGAHWISDVVVGLALGVIVSFAMVFALSNFNKYVVYAVVIVVGAAGFFYCTTSDYYTSYGLLVGFVCAVLFEEKVTKFENTKTWWRIALRVIGGGIVYLAVSKLLKLPVKGLLYSGDEVKAGMETWEHVYRTFRYAVTCFVTMGVYPLLFKPVERLWIKLKLVKAE